MVVTAAVAEIDSHRLPRLRLSYPPTTDADLLAVCEQHDCQPPELLWFAHRSLGISHWQVEPVCPPVLVREPGSQGGLFAGYPPQAVVYGLWSPRREGSTQLCYQRLDRQRGVLRLLYRPDALARGYARAFLRVLGPGERHEHFRARFQQCRVAA